MSRDDHELMGMVEVGDGLYLRAEAEKIATWVTLAGVLVELVPEHADNVKLATEALAKKAQQQYPQLESNEGVTLDVDDLDGWLDSVLPTHQEKMTFLMVTGDVLLACIDGPNVASGVLCRAIDAMTPTSPHQ